MDQLQQQLSQQLLEVHSYIESVKQEIRSVQEQYRLMRLPFFGSEVNSQLNRAISQFTSPVESQRSEQVFRPVNSIISVDFGTQLTEP